MRLAVSVEGGGVDDPGAEEATLESCCETLEERLNADTGTKSDKRPTSIEWNRFQVAKRTDGEQL